MSLRHSKQKFKILMLAVLVGFSAWSMILMYKIGMPCALPFEKQYSEGSLPAQLCPALSDSSSLR
ncbi:hypothetical protein BZ335_22360 [Salmonella enterica subsp. enterica serovar Enteritidis]|nr:hypothetical protein [Salmonella enterica subsp. enterica serovar Enteritidis]